MDLESKEEIDSKSQSSAASEAAKSKKAVSTADSVSTVQGAKKKIKPLKPKCPSIPPPNNVVCFETHQQIYDSMHGDKLGENILQALNALGMPQSELAQMIKISTITINRMISGSNSSYNSVWIVVHTLSKLLYEKELPSPFPIIPPSSEQDESADSQFGEEDARP